MLGASNRRVTDPGHSERGPVVPFYRWGSRGTAAGTNLPRPLGRAHEGAETEHKRVDRGNFCINIRVRKKPTTPSPGVGGYPYGVVHPLSRPRTHSLVLTGCVRPPFFWVFTRRKRARPPGRWGQTTPTGTQDRCWVNPQLGDTNSRQWANSRPPAR